VAAEINKRTIAAGTVGTVLEWYDFGVYAFLATVLAKHFFPTGDGAISLIATFGVFASGYLMRPVGAVFLGHIGDRLGRRPALIIAVAIMAAATTAIALVPTYETIGLAAPILLTGLRLLQGVAVGGEYTGAAVFLVEAAPARRRALVAGAALGSGVVGVLAASGAAALLATLMSADAFTDWGWRLLYAPAPLLGVVGVFLRRRLAVDGMERGVADRGLPVVMLFRDQWPSLLKVMGLTATNAVGNYTVFIYGATYLQTVAGLPEDVALDINTATTAALLVILLAFAWLADRIGRRPVMIFGAGGVLLCTYPLFVLFASGDPAQALAAQLGFAVFIGAIGGGLAATMCELFPRAVRYTGVSVGYGITYGLMGGIAPLVATSLIDLTGNRLSPAFYVMLAGAISLVALWWTPETRERALE
jgi:MHS family proline/betaine transporter-like MFS transporter